MYPIRIARMKVGAVEIQVRYITKYEECKVMFRPPERSGHRMILCKDNYLERENNLNIIRMYHGTELPLSNASIVICLSSL